MPEGSAGPAPVARSAGSSRGQWVRARLAGAGLVAALVLAGCGGGAATGTEVAGVRVDPRTAPRASNDGNTQRGVEFARWVQATDPQRRYILDAFVRDDRVLGVKVNPNMTTGEVNQAMGSLLNGMQRTFPNRSLEVIAYYESGDELARTTYDARTGQVRTTWAR